MLALAVNATDLDILSRMAKRHDGKTFFLVQCRLLLLQRMKNRKSQ